MPAICAGVKAENAATSSSSKSAGVIPLIAAGFNAITGRVSKYIDEEEHTCY
jgi:hypothetical protein